jgi:DNA polymerase III alpha subunit
MCDKYDAERLDMLKIDALGLTQLSVFERTLELIGEKPICGFLEKIPLDDQAAYDVLNRQHFSGIFQFVGRAVRSLGQQMLFMGGKFDRFDDLVALTALARPGPMGGGSAEEWVRRRVGFTPVSYVHPAFEPYLKSTYGVVIYQEQVLAIGRELGDLSWDDVTKLRKAMSRSLGKEYFAQFGDRWKAGAVKRGIPEEVLDKQWDDLVNFGAWAFNKAHSVAYGTVSYQCCWLKAHHPIEFAAATLDVENDPQNQINTLRELRDEGVEYVSVDPDTSGKRWTKTERNGKTVLVGPLTSIKGIGPASVTAILEARKVGKKLKTGLQKKLDEARTEIDSLYPIRDTSLKLIEEAKEKVELLEAKEDRTELEDEDLKRYRQISLIKTEPVTIADIFNTENDYNDKEVMIICIMTRMDQTNENALLRVQKRGGRTVTGPSESVQMFAKDDTGEMFCKINRYDFERIGRAISERGSVGKAIYALKGPLWVKADFRMLWVKNARYIGDIR